MDTVSDSDVAVESSDEPTDMVAPTSHHQVRLIDVIDRLYEGQEVFFHYIQTAGDIMNTEVKTLTLDHKIADGMQFLDKHSVRHIPIVEEEALIGIVSQRDLARVLSPGANTLVQTKVDDVVFTRPLSTLITRNPHTVTAATPFVEVIQLMIDEHVDCLPVVMGNPAEEQKVHGILTTTDIIKCFLRMEVLRKARAEKPETSRLIDMVPRRGINQPTELMAGAMMSCAADIMHDTVVTVTMEESLGQAIQLMEQHRIRHLPVLDAKGQVKGILSDRDILLHLPSAVKESARKKQDGQAGFRDTLFHIDPKDNINRAALSIKVAIAMTGSPVTVEPTTPLVRVVELFYTRRIGAVPVVTADSTIAGIVTQIDILRAILVLGRLYSNGNGSAHR